LRQEERQQTLNQIDLYEDQQGQLHLHECGDTIIYDLDEAARPGGFEADARQLATAGVLHTYEHHDAEAASMATWQYVATWYGPGVFLVYPDAKTISRSASRYIGSYLIHAPQVAIDDGNSEADDS
jgi:hypothetical protein